MPPYRKVAYLLSQYPAVSHTFFLNEVMALRERGFVVETASINTVVPPSDGFSARELQESGQTFYVKAMSKTAAALKVVSVAFRHPAVVLRGLAEVFILVSWDFHEAMYFLFYLAEALLVGAWMQERGCSHLHVHFGGPVASVALLTAAAWDVPYSLTVHGPDEFFDIDKFRLRRKVERAKFVVCISDFCKSQLIRLAPQHSWEKFHVSRLGVDVGVFHPADRSGSVTPRLICVGRLHPSKGQIVLLKAMSLLKRRGLPLSLDLVGDGSERATVEDLIAVEGLQELVTLHGATSHAKTRSLLEQADIFVLASFAEGIPVALMEAMAMEIACVSTFVAGIPELIRTGEDGLLVPPASVEKLSDAIERLVTAPNLRMRLARAGRAKVIEEYEQTVNADHLAEIFRRYEVG